MGARERREREKKIRVMVKVCLLVRRERAGCGSCGGGGVSQLLNTDGLGKIGG